MTGQRSKVEIMNDLLRQTNRMLSGRNDADRLVEGVEKRQALIEEFDGSDEEPGEQEALEIRRIAKEIMEKDKIISTALQQFHREAKNDLAESNKKQRVLGYANLAVSGSGSYMDFKK